MPALEKLYPSGLEEIRGIADGAGVPVKDIVMLNSRYDLARCMYQLQNGGRTPQSGDEGAIALKSQVEDECTSGFFSPEATESGSSLAVHNWDMSSHLYDNDLVIYLEVHPDPSENRPSMFILTEAGQLIRSGMNSAGLSVTANSLLCSTDYVPVSYINENGIFHRVDHPKSVLPLSLARRIFLEHSVYSEGLAAVNAFPRHVSGNLHVSSAGGFAMALEVTSDRIYKFYGTMMDDNYLIHSNHFLSPAFMGRHDVYDRSTGGSTWFRFWQAERSVRKYRDGRLTKELIRTAFSDHFSYPESLCQHPNIRGENNGPSHVLTGYTSKLSMTVAFVIYDLSDMVITVCKGPPCQGVLQEFKLKPRHEVKMTAKEG
jgi:hypothetical protein